MANKKVLPKSSDPKIKPEANLTGKKEKQILIPEKVAGGKSKKPVKKSSALLAASKGRSAVDAVKGHSSVDVRGTSGLADTGTIISYD